MDEPAERFVLGSLIHESSMLPEVAGLIAPEYFATPSATLIFNAIVSVLDQGAPVTALSVVRELEARGVLAEVGGFAAILALDSTCSPLIFRHELERLRYLALNREVARTARQLADIENAPDPLEEFSRLAGEVDRLRDKQRGIRPGVLPELEDALELLIRPPAEPAPLIEGVLHRSMKGTIGGTSKSFKTWCLVDLAVSVATGADWWGFTTKRGRVAYLNFEIPSAFFARRLAAVTDAKEVRPEKGDLLVWNLRGHSAPLTVLGPRIIEKIKRTGEVALIIVDPIYKMMPGQEENSTKDYSVLCAELDKVATETGAAIVYGSHFSKGNQAQKESIDRISGSGITARDPDAIITLTKHEEEDAFTVDSVLRNCPPVDPFVLRWEFPLMQRDGGLNPAKLKKAKSGRELIYTTEDLLSPLADGAELTTKEWYERVHEETGMSERSFHLKRPTLLRDKKVRKSAISGKWCLA